MPGRPRATAERLSRLADAARNAVLGLRPPRMYVEERDNGSEVGDLWRDAVRTVGDAYGALLKLRNHYLLKAEAQAERLRLAEAVEAEAGAEYGAEGEGLAEADDE